MPIPFNIREQTIHGVPSVTADFVIADGRTGSVSVPADLFRLHGETLLQQEAEAVEADARRHQYKPPQHDRYREFR